MERRAFTAIETLLTIGIIAVTAGVSIPMYRNFQIKSDLDRVTEQTIQGLQRSQLLSRSGEQDSMWGFYVPEGVLFLGEGYVLRDDRFDEIYPVPSTIDVSGIEEVVFSRIDGVPNVTGDIIIEALNGDRRIITISLQGAISTTGIIAPEIPIGDSGDTQGDSAGQTGDTATDGDTGDTGSTADTGEGESTGSDGGAETGETVGGTDGSTDGGDTGTAGDTGDTGDTGGGSGSSSSSSSDSDDAPCEDRFSVSANGTIETTGSVDATFKVLGSQITYGSNGPEVDVRVSVSTDGGDDWSDLFDGKDVDGGEEEAVTNIVSGKQIALRFKGRFGILFNQTYKSNDGSGHVEVLRNGDALPDYPIFGNQSNLANFLSNIVDDSGHISIGEYDAVMLVELGSLGSSSADFQDAVVLVQFAQKEGSCAKMTDKTMTVHFDRVANTGNGDATNVAYVGSDAIAFAQDQEIPLEINGQAIIDSGLVEAVPGISIQRQNGAVRILQHGSHTGSSGKEITDVRVTFNGATIVGVDNDTGNNATENPFDTVTNDGSGGDEVTVSSSNKSVLFQTRVTTSDDAIIVRWTQSAASSSSSSSSVSNQGSSSSAGSAGSAASSSSSSTGDTGGDQSGEENDETSTDACAAAYTLNADGSITLDELADITAFVRGSYALYGGIGGPEIRVHMSISVDGGSTWQSLYNFRDIDGNESEELRDVPAGSTILLKAEGRYGWLYRSFSESDDGSGRMRIVRNGDPVPGTSPYASPSTLQSFVRSIISNGTVSVGAREAVYFVELQDLNTSSDHQDAVISLYIEKPTSQGICGAENEEDTTGGDTGDTSGQDSSGSSSSTSSLPSEEEEEVTLCHYPPGNAKNFETMVVGSSAVKGHLNHGDRLGACDGDSDGDGVQNKEDICPDTSIPESVPTEGLLFNRYALTQDSYVFREGPRKKIGEFTLKDTKGCSCEQMIDVAEDVKSYHFNQFPKLQRLMRSLFPFYTSGARRNGCGVAIIRMIQKNVD